MLDDKFWIIMPKSRRPIRITPLQKLLGEASTGDIANMTWSEDYEGVVKGQSELNGVRCLELDLHSIRKGTTYARIRLWVEEKSYRPVKANLYVESGKLAKEATFSLGEIGGRRRVVAMTLIDKIQKNKSTVVRYLAMKEGEVADKLYNPAFLARQARR